jgi:hypothetical protein
MIGNLKNHTPVHTIPYRCAQTPLSVLCLEILNEALFLYQKNGDYVITEVVGALVGGTKFRVCFSGGSGIESHGLRFV